LVQPVLLETLALPVLPVLVDNKVILAPPVRKELVYKFLAHYLMSLSFLNTESLVKVT
jgi:hypothetical protein